MAALYAQRTCFALLASKNKAGCQHEEASIKLAPSNKHSALLSRCYIQLFITHDNSGGAPVGLATELASKHDSCDKLG